MNCFRPMFRWSPRFGQGTRLLVSSGLTAAALLRVQGALLRYGTGLTSSADGEFEGDVVAGLNSAPFYGRPFEKSHRKSMLTAADLRKQR